jgi:hypothetical protein
MTLKKNLIVLKSNYKLIFVSKEFFDKLNWCFESYKLIENKMKDNVR